MVYYCSPNHSINSTLDSYGLKNCTHAFFAVFLNTDAQAIQAVKQELSKAAQEQPDLNKHLQWQDQTAVLQMFDLKEKERELPMANALLTSMYSKLALKNL